MQNLIVWLVGVATVALWSAFYADVHRRSFTWFLKATALAAVLTLPVNVGGNVFTIAGNVVAEENAYSILSFYQEAKHGSVFSAINLGYQEASDDATSLLNLAYQRAGRGDAIVATFGLAYQEAGRDAIVAFGLGHQKAGRDAIVAFGLGHQKAGRDATMLFGAAYQRAERNSFDLVGLAVQNAERDAVGAGFGIQRAGHEARTYLGIGVYQRAGSAVRTFGVWSPLRNPDAQ